MNNPIPRCAKPVGANLTGGRDSARPHSPAGRFFLSLAAETHGTAKGGAGGDGPTVNHRRPHYQEIADLLNERDLAEKGDTTMHKYSQGPWAHQTAKRTPVPGLGVLAWLALVLFFVLITFALIWSYTPPAAADVPAPCVSAGC